MSLSSSSVIAASAIIANEPTDGSEHSWYASAYSYFVLINLPSLGLEGGSKDGICEVEMVGWRAYYDGQGLHDHLVDFF